MAILDEIIVSKKIELKAQKEFIDEETLISYIELSLDEPRGFVSALQRKIKQGKTAIIAEAKKASPSLGTIRNVFIPQVIAKAYEDNGATCISVLTEKNFFQGSIINLRKIRAATKLPLLRKDFLFEEYQVIESRAIGADCILLVASILEHQELLNMTRLAYDLGMDVLVEVHNEQELEKVLSANLPIHMIGINNRNLKDLTINLDNSIELMKKIPKDIIVVSESGISTKEDISKLKAVGINCFLIGAALMKLQDIGSGLKTLLEE